VAHLLSVPTVQQLHDRWVASALVQPPRRITSFPLLAAAVISAAAFSLRGDGEDGFWINHPMLGALVSGAILFAAGSLIVGRLVESHNARRWDAASIAANRDLGHVLDETLGGMWLVHSDADPEEGDSSRWTPAARARDLPAPARDLAVYHQELPQPDYTGVALTPQDRLSKLLEDADFVERARVVVDTRRNLLRAAAKEWAGLMMWAQHSQTMLNALGIYAEEHLSRVGYELHCNPESSAAHRREAVEQWLLADVKGRALMNELWGSNTRYRFVLPEEARGVSLREAFRHQDAVGRWRPPPKAHLTAKERRARQLRWRLGRMRDALLGH
jgi:hypothetical protein